MNRLRKCPIPTENQCCGTALVSMRFPYPDPAFNLNADPGSQTNADPCASRSGSWYDLAVTKRKIFDMKNILYLGTVICHKTYLRRYKCYFERLEFRLIFFVQFSQVFFLAPGSGSAFPLRVRIQESQINADPC